MNQHTPIPVILAGLFGDPAQSPTVFAATHVAIESQQVALLVPTTSGEARSLIQTLTDPAWRGINVFLRQVRQAQAQQAAVLIDGQTIQVIPVADATQRILVAARAMVPPPALPPPSASLPATPLAVTNNLGNRNNAESAMIPTASSDLPGLSMRPHTPGLPVGMTILAGAVPPPDVLPLLKRYGLVGVAPPDALGDLILSTCEGETMVPPQSALDRDLQSLLTQAGNGLALVFERQRKQYVVYVTDPARMRFTVAEGKVEREAADDGAVAYIGQFLPPALKQLVDGLHVIATHGHPAQRAAVGLLAIAGVGSLIYSLPFVIQSGIYPIYALGMGQSWFARLDAIYPLNKAFPSLAWGIAASFSVVEPVCFLLWFVPWVRRGGKYIILADFLLVSWYYMGLRLPLTGECSTFDLPDVAGVHGAIACMTHQNPVGGGLQILGELVMALITAFVNSFASELWFVVSLVIVVITWRAAFWTCGEIFRIFLISLRDAWEWLQDVWEEFRSTRGSVRTIRAEPHVAHGVVYTPPAEPETIYEFNGRHYTVDGVLLD